MSSESSIILACVAVLIAMFGLYEFLMRRSGRRDRMELRELRKELSQVRAERDKLIERAEHQTQSFEQGLELGYAHGYGQASRNNIRSANRRQAS